MAVAPDADAALAMVRAAEFDPAQTVVVEGWPASVSTGIGGEAAILAYAPEQVTIRTRSRTPALLVLSDSDYPGWVATVDGDVVPIYRSNVLMRGVHVPAGEHEVVFRYAPRTWQRGLWASALGGLLLLLCWGAPLVRPGLVRAPLRDRV
jgi:hypothetical protein